MFNPYSQSCMQMADWKRKITSGGGQILWWRARTFIIHTRYIISLFISICSTHFSPGSTRTSYSSGVFGFADYGFELFFPLYIGDECACVHGPVPRRHMNNNNGRNRGGVIKKIFIGKETMWIYSLEQVQEFMRRVLFRTTVRKFVRVAPSRLQIFSLSSRAKYPLEASSRCDPAEPDRQKKFPYYFGLR